MNIKKIIIFCFVIGLIATLGACSGNQKNQTNTNAENVISASEPEKVPKIEKNIDSVAEFLGITNGSETLYSIIGAIAGKEYNNGSIELYQFEEKSDAYKQIIGENSPLKISAFKDGIVLLFPAGAEADKDLIDKFNSIEFK